ncbi:uncharacterized protein LOC105686631 [Athalia rosae]|uniref:uncharacterized protein LOC105686631 n=1 Tax=Athalia rosae TaxID=37344 RepID=UPI002033F492|nr:uncharacterized protein LOC105686631 [Athalia rosae]XP_012257064.2 uncharacterized protein LOC105686631 [Athalia rosae]
MAGALSENGPRPVSVIAVDGTETQQHQQQQLPQQQQLNRAPLHHHHRNQEQQQQQQNSSNDVSSRSFISTEAQTESTTCGQISCSQNLPQTNSVALVSAVPVTGGSPGPLESNTARLVENEETRDARRRERRLRRQHRRAMRSCSVPPSYAGGPCGVGPAVAPSGVPIVPPGGNFLHPPPPHLGLRGLGGLGGLSGLSLGLPFPVPTSVSAFGRDSVPKQCCGLGSPPVRWSILGVGVVGLVCAGAGALLGALRATGRDHIAVALLMIGIGVVLVTVSAVAWRVTSREHCGSFFGFTGISGRIPPARPIHPYAAMIYPEFQFRPPPPSYQASMQEYRLRLLLLDRLQPTSSPPPTYRSNAGSVAAPGGTTRESRPPSYCGRPNLTASTNLQVPSSNKKDANLVRIVQTESEPVILSGDQTPPVTAVEVLAHL